MQTRTRLGIRIDATSSSRRQRPVPAPLGASRWAGGFYFDADQRVALGTSPQVGTWTSTGNAIAAAPVTAPPDLVYSFSVRSMASVQFVKASTEDLECDAAGAAIAGDDVEFLLAMHLTIDALATNDCIISFGDASDANQRWALRASSGAALRLNTRGTGDAAQVNSGSVTVATGTEYVLTLARAAAATRCGLNGAFTDLTVNCGALTVDRCTIGALRLNDVASTPASISVRRAALSVGAGTDADVAAIVAAWLGH